MMLACGDSAQACQTRNLFVVRVIVAPVPVSTLVFAVHLLVLDIVPVLFGEITAIGVVFMIVPIMVVTVIPIVDADLYARFLRFGCGNDHGWRKDHGRQDE